MKNKKYLGKFKIKIYKILIFISLIPLLIISISSLYFVIQTRQQNIAELQNLAIENTIERVNRFIDDKMESLNLVLDTPGDLSTMDLATREQVIDFYKHLSENLQSSLGDISEITFTDKFGKEIVKRSGVHLVSNLNYINHKPEFIIAVKGQEYFGPVEHTILGPTMVLASQIENKDREIIGIITVKINLRRINSIVSMLTLGTSGYVYILDDQGRLITNYGGTGTGVRDNLLSFNLIKDVVKNKNTHNGLVNFETFDNIAGDEVVFAGCPLERFNWSIISEWPRDDAFSVIDNILKISFMVVLFTLLLVIFVSLFMVNQIIKPIKILSEGAKAISKGDLEHRINLKTADEFEVLGDRFNEMIKILKENHKLRDEFVFIAAHELRTPVTAIKGYLSMILDGSFGPVSEKIKPNIKIINQSNERLVQLVQDLLEVARSEAGKMKIELTPLLLSENVEIILNELKSLSDQKNISLIYNKDLAGRKVNADPYKIKEVLTNVIGNAIKYTLDNGDIEISHEISGEFLITHIKDHGLGMTAEQVQKLFSKFYRVQTKETADIEGTGLGLFICKEIIERMGGKIWVKSESGKGSTFSFSLKIVN